VRQDMPLNDVEKLTENFSKIITDNNGQVVYTEYWGLRNLSYIINKNKKGHYVMLSLDAPSAAIDEMERLMRLNEDILRNATFKVDVLTTESSHMMKSSSDDEIPDVVEVISNDNLGGEI
jgi:small subunit ribosomal protein S6